MEFTKEMNIGEYLFTESEVKEVASLINEIVATVKKHNPTFAQADEALRLSRVRIKGLKIDSANIDQTTEKAQRLVDLLNKAKTVANSLFGNSDNTAKKFINDVIKHLNEV